MTKQNLLPFYSSTSRNCSLRLDHLKFVEERLKGSFGRGYDRICR